MRSDTVTKGKQQAPHRSLFNALGMTQEEMDRPLVGIVSSYNEIVPGHMNLDKIVNAVKQGVAMAGGTPVVFPAIAVCDGIAMGHIGMKYSLVTRDLIADSTEAMAMAHQFDALVMVPNCDKNVPGLLMAAARINIPTIFVSGGPMLAGHVKGQKRSLSSMFEAVGANAAGTLSDEDLCEFENKVCPTCGSCSGMYTANSMNCLTEVLGMGLRGNGTIPAVYSERIRLAKHAGMKVMELLEKNIRLNLCDEQDRQAWEYLQTMDREKYKSYTRAVVVALNDYFSREYRNEADPYLETREKEDAFLERVETAVRDGVKESAPMAIAKNLMEMLVPFVKESVGESKLSDRILTMEKKDGEITEDNLDWEKEADMDAALDFADSF